MIELSLSGEDYEQDIRPLISAFYPEEGFSVIKGTNPETPAATRQESSEKDSIQAKGNGLPGIRIHLQLWKQKFRITVCPAQVLLAEAENEKKTDCVCTAEEEIMEAEPDTRRSRYRKELLQALYRLLERITGKRLPWGTLTGVRPVKLVLDQLNAGASREEIFQKMKRDYYCSEEKIDISIRVAAREKEILDSVLEPGSYSLYLGIPFCPTTCAYCSFTSYPLERFSELVVPYLGALTRELSYAAERMRDRRLTTVYFGGGTPTTLSAEQLHMLLRLIRENFDCSGVRELTVEAGRPDSLNDEKLQALKEEGVTRISINPQSMRQRTLELIGRRHTAEQIVDVFRLARAAGHDNINMDLILGLPGEGPEDVAYTLSRIAELDPDSLTVHTLAKKRAARLTTEKEQYEGLAAREVGRMQELSRQFTMDHGYLPYYLYRQKNMADNLENVGYAKPGKEGIYNILIMEERQTILALGAGGSSKFVFPENGRIERVENVKSLTDYIARIEEMIQRKQKFYQQYSL